MIQIMQILKKEQNLSVESVIVMEISKMEHIVVNNVNMMYIKNVLIFYFHKTKIPNINNHNKKNWELLTKMKIRNNNK